MSSAIPTGVDLFGQRLTAVDATAVAHWNETIDNILAHAAATPASLAATLDRAPDFAMAHAVKGLSLMLLCRSELVASAEASLAAARRAARETHPSSREAAYVEALAALVDGRPAAAIAHLDGALAESPRDALAVKLAHQLRFLVGDKHGMVAGLRNRARNFAGTPAHGYVLGCLAFALEETQDYAAAEMVARQAIEIEPRDAWGRHALAHVLEMTGRSREGAEWLAAIAEDWRHCNNFSFHLYWHLALFLVEQGRIGEVLALYDREIRRDRTDDYRDLANGAALLQRLELEGVDVGSRWEELADIAGRRVADRRLVFADLHYVMALAGAGRAREAGALARALATPGGRGHDDKVALEVGAMAAEGVIAFHAGRHALAARLLSAVRPRLAAIGGSDAQRDVFDQMLIESLVAGGEIDRAADMLQSRLLARGGDNAFAARRLAAKPKRESDVERRLGVLALASAPIASLH